MSRGVTHAMPREHEPNQPILRNREAIQLPAL